MARISDVVCLLLVLVACSTGASAIASSHTLQHTTQDGRREIPNESIVESEPWWRCLTKSFYHMAILPMLVVTIVLAWAARPSVTEEMPPGFGRFQFMYLSVWAVCVAADWLQGPYVYALYSAYGFSKTEIAQLFVAGFAAAGVFGCFAGALADRWGRKRCCMLYCILYIVSCMTKHYRDYRMLMLGRVTGGIATSMLMSCFECWMVAESTLRRYSSGLLSYLFGWMFIVMYGVAILAGLVAQYCADSFAFLPISEGSSIYTGGVLAPFDLSILCLMIGLVMISVMWTENYGNHSMEIGNAPTIGQQIGQAYRLAASDRRLWLLCIIVGCFEGSMYAFVFNWTPSLESKAVPPPYGIIFALFMMACMCGASVHTIIADTVPPAVRLTVIFVFGIVAFAAAARFSGGASVQLIFSAFLVFEFCVGIYFPAIGVLKSEAVPEHVRGTIYNMYRMPLNAIVVALLLSHISVEGCFSFCAALLCVALVAVVSLQLWPGASTECDPVLGRAEKRV